MTASQQASWQTLQNLWGTQQTQQATQPNTDKFVFVIANPNTNEPKKFIFELKPGQQARDSVIVKNEADVPLTFSLYGADGTKTKQGTFALCTKNEQPKDIGKWITFDQKEITLNPGEQRLINFIISIPSDTPLGDYSGGVAAEKSQADTNNPSLIIAVRIGLRVDVKVTDNPQPITKKYSVISNNPFFQVYFWASLLLFVASAGVLVWAYIKEKRQKKKHWKL